MSAPSTRVPYLVGPAVADARRSGGGTVYSENVTVVSFLKALRRKLTPPGNRGSLDTEYRQPNADPTHAASAAGAVEHQADQWAGGI